MRVATAGRAGRECRGPIWGLLALLVVQAAVALVSPAQAWAQEAPRSRGLSDVDKKKVSEHYDKGNRYYQVGKYPEAIVEFEAAYLIGADPVMIFNIAQSYRMNNQPEEAARFYRNYLRTAPDAPNRGAVEKQIAEMDRRAVERRSAPVTPTTPPVSTPAPPPVTTPAGPPAGAPGTVSPPAAGPYPPPMTPGPSEGGISTTAPPAVERPSRVLPMVMMVGGGVMVATSLIFGGVAASRAKEVGDRSQSGNQAFDARTKDLEAEGKRASGVAVVSGLVGLAAGGFGLYLWLRSSPEETPAAAGPTVAPAARARLFPLAAPGLVGAGAQVAF